jgi:hypothetical protein
MFRRHRLETRMRGLLGFSAIAVVGIMTGAAQMSSTYSHSEAQRYIESSEAALAESAVTNDISVVERIMAEDCVWVLDGKVLTKSEAVADAKRSSDFLSNHLDYAHVRFFQDTAVVQGSETWCAKGAARVAISGLTHGFGAMEIGRS